MNTMSLLEPRTLYDPATGQTYEVYTDIGGPRLPGEIAPRTTCPGCNGTGRCERCTGRGSVSADTKSCDPLVRELALVKQALETGMPPAESSASLAGARAIFAASLEAAAPGKPVVCPCCDHAHRNYRRKLNSGMAAVLIRIYRLGGGAEAAWVNVVRIFPNTTHRGGEWSLLRHWGLVMPRERRSGVKNSVGDWRLTPLGVAFVEGSLEVPRYVEVRNGKLIGKSTETTRIVAALGNAFRYDELMKGEG